MRGLLAEVEEGLLARLPDGAARRLRERVRVRPTRDGLWFGVVLLGVLLAAINTGNNLLYAVLSCLLALLVLSNGLAEWNLRGLAVERRLPAELFAGQAGEGAFVVSNLRRRGGGTGLVLVEVDEEGALQEPATVSWLPAGECVDAPARWSIGRRGWAHLCRVRLSSSFPFGLVERWRLLELPATVLVYPEPAPGPVARSGSSAGIVRPHLLRRGVEAEFRGLRPYVEGDPLRDVHWLTSARTGSLVVVERAGALAEEAVIEVEASHHAGWEVALARATGQVNRHFRAGHAVGLRLCGQLHPPRTGEAWRRHLLSLLALAPSWGELP